MKKKICFSVLFSVLLSASLYAQNEPDFVGEAYALTPGGTIKLEKSPVQLKTKAGASVYITGIGKVKTRITVNGNKSGVRFNESDKMQFIIRAVDNQTDPLSIIKIIKFETTKKERRAEVQSASTFGGSSSNNLTTSDFEAAKHGESSYLISLNLMAGEYGIIVSNPNALDEKATIVSCFGID